jgi:S-adenosylmethionine synthetase
MTGYDHPVFNSRTCGIMTSLSEHPAWGCPFPDRELDDEEIEAVPVRNQVTLFGFACDQTAALMPLPIWLAHRLSRRLTSVRLQKIVPYLAPDGKAQVGIEYRDGVPKRIHSVSVIASQQPWGAPEMAKLREEVREAVIGATFAEEEIKPDRKTQIFINSEGPLVVGGPSVHSGLTGRKNAIDTYGEYARHSGTALSGKDPLRIDRVGAYAAKNVVAAGLARECEVQLSYGIGSSRPVSIQAETFGTGKLDDASIAALLERHFEFRLAGIVQQFNLRRLPMQVKGGFYRKLAAYGQVGRMDIGLPWEVTDKMEQLREGSKG